VLIIVHNCRTQHSTEQLWLSSLLSSRQASELRCCLLEWRGRGLRVCPDAYSDSVTAAEDKRATQY